LYLRLQKCITYTPVQRMLVSYVLDISCLTVFIRLKEQSQSELGVSRQGQITKRIVM
jgi:hypothetical protein